MWGPGDVAFFDRVATWYDLLHPSPDADLFRTAFTAADRPVQTVLDLAGGTGRVARLLDPRTVVLDRSSGMLRRAERHSDAVLGDATRLPIRPGGVDAVVCVDAFHHLPAREVALEECARVLSHGGVLVLVDFDPGTILGRLVAAGEHAIGMESTFYDRARAIATVESAGFEIVAVDGGWATYCVVARQPSGE
jgi:demethylmenaquinone methyltransferase/2-methoxy-6-polyprenyl-1,4-benzoquinol methylase